MLGRLCILAPLACSLATAQTAPAPAAEPKTYAFDVVSIRLDKAPPNPALFDQDGATADGYRSHQSLGLPLLTAYRPQTGGAAMYSFQQIKGMPDWIADRYDIDARISDADRAEWQDAGARKRMLESMLQSLLADRCRLAVHREVKQANVATLVVAKGGLKLAATDPAAPVPAGAKLPWGGVTISRPDGLYFYDTSMASFASFLGNMVNHGQAVEDMTGLTGHYDFSVRSIAASGPAGEDDGESPLATQVLSGLGSLGLKLDSEKGQVETLVIDHIERPTEN